MGEREEMMRYHELYTCPAWCLQDPEEEQYEMHWSQWREFTTHDGAATIGVRPRRSWWTDDDGEPTERVVELDVAVDPECTSEGVTSDKGRVGTWLSRDDMVALRELLDAAEADLDNFDDEKPAYDGAEADQDEEEDDEQESASTEPSGKES